MSSKKKKAKRTSKPKPNPGGPSTVRAARISKDVHADIGRLVRGFAEIEDIITLHICSLAKIKEGAAFILLGRSNLSKKIEIARYLAKKAGKETFDVHNAVFNDYFSKANKCRNVVAHGTLLGKDESGALTFLTSTAIDSEGPNATMETVHFPPRSIKFYAEYITRALPMIEAHLMLGASRKKRREQRLSAHPKGRTRVPQTSKRQAQPKS